MNENINFDDVPESVPESHTEYSEYRARALVHDLITIGKNSGSLSASDPTYEDILVHANVSGNTHRITEGMKRIAQDYLYELRLNPALRSAILLRAFQILGEQHFCHTQETWQLKTRSGIRSLVHNIGIPIRPRLTPEHKQHDLEREFLRLAFEALTMSAGMKKDAKVRTDYVPKEEPKHESLYWVPYVTDRYFRHLCRTCHEAGALRADGTKKDAQVTGDVDDIRAACKTEIDTMRQRFGENKPILGVILHRLKYYADSWHQHSSGANEPEPSSMWKVFEKRMMHLMRDRKFEAKMQAKDAINTVFYGIILQEIDAAIEQHNQDI